MEKGKRFTADVILYKIKLDSNLFNLKTLLETEQYKVGSYKQFRIYDPKVRIITAAGFEDRIVHHAIMNV